MSAKPKKRIAPTLLGQVPDANAATNAATVATNAAAVATNGAVANGAVANAFEAAAKKKNPLENAADLIAMRYGISGDAPQINEAVFAKNRAIGKKVVPLKEYFEQTAKDFKEKEVQQKEEVTRKKRENAKLSPCQRKLNTLQRTIDGYIQACDPALSNDAMIEMLDKARTKERDNTQPKAQTNAQTKTKPKSRDKSRTKKNTRASSSRLSSKKGGRTMRR
jgi:hypothetical protein